MSSRQCRHTAFSPLPLTQISHAPAAKVAQCDQCRQQFTRAEADAITASHVAAMYVTVAAPEAPMDDRELLELAAKAFGGTLIWRDRERDERFSPRLEGHGVWNPLNDDGDALRLAVKLDIWIAPNYCGNSAAVIDGEGGVHYITMHKGDKLAATRLAITRAAAEIGRAMP